MVAGDFGESTVDIYNTATGFWRPGKYELSKYKYFWPTIHTLNTASSSPCVSKNFTRACS